MSAERSIPVIHHGAVLGYESKASATRALHKRQGIKRRPDQNPALTKQRRMMSSALRKAEAAVARQHLAELQAAYNVFLGQVGIAPHPLPPPSKKGFA